MRDLSLWGFWVSCLIYPVTGEVPAQGRDDRRAVKERHLTPNNTEAEEILELARPGGDQDEETQDEESWDAGAEDEEIDWETSFNPDDGCIYPVEDEADEGPAFAGMSEEKEPVLNQDVKLVPLGNLVTNPLQPRRHFDGEAMDALIKSIAQKGVLQPVLVRAMPGKDNKNRPEHHQKGHHQGHYQDHFSDGTPRGGPDYQIIAGERRWRAASLAGVKVIPVLIREITDAESLEIGVIENDQRVGLNPMEEARAFSLLMSRYGYTQREIGQVIGKSRSYVTNALRLFQLPDRVQFMLIEGKLAAGHGRAILNSHDPAYLADHIIEHGLSVRAAERLGRKMRLAAWDGEQNLEDRIIADTGASAQIIENELGLKVSIYDRGGRGHVKVYYRDIEDYQKVSRRLRRRL